MGRLPLFLINASCYLENTPNLPAPLHPMERGRGRGRGRLTCPNQLESASANLGKIACGFIHRRDTDDIIAVLRK